MNMYFLPKVGWHYSLDEVQSCVGFVYPSYWHIVPLVIYLIPFLLRVVKDYLLSSCHENSPDLMVGLRGQALHYYLLTFLSSAHNISFTSLASDVKTKKNPWVQCLYFRRSDLYPPLALLSGWKNRIIFSSSNYTLWVVQLFLRLSREPYSAMESSIMMGRL